MLARNPETIFEIWFKPAVLCHGRRPAADEKTSELGHALIGLIAVTS